ncbi:MAG TPA: DUF1015 domain-containing protein [Thermoleophilia bacterium]|nr:DUF1015 domain-containing protein [Thermoleophilia bacterium]
MAEVRPFRGLRYDEQTDLDLVVAPPYDVLDADQTDKLRRRSPLNAVHVDLPVGPGEAPSDEAYDRAAALLSLWRRDGALVRDEEPAVYLVDQTYRGPDGAEHMRRGFVARLTLAALEERVVLPHEKTHAGPKVDRLRLYRATHADISTIFLLYPDDDGAVSAELAAAAAELGIGGGEPDPAGVRSAHDGDGNVHRIAAVGGERAARITSLLAGQSLYIADGHHRYETALAYRDERRAAGDHRADTLMVYLCSMRDPGLMVFPAHRMVKGIEMPPMEEVLGRLEPAFTVVFRESAAGGACEGLVDRLRDTVDPGRSFGLYFPREKTCCLVTLTDAGALERLAGLAGEGMSPEAARLSVTILHRLILGDGVGIDPAHSEGLIDYVVSTEEALRRLEAGEYAFGAFLTATGVDEVRAVADNGETMPQKSTYFYPKLLTGLVFDALGD